MKNKTLITIILSSLPLIAWKQPTILKPYTDYKYGGAKTDVSDLEKGYADPNEFTMILEDIKGNKKDQTIIEYKNKTYFLKEKEDGSLLLVPFEKKTKIKELNQQ
ncbi:hypothetical protein HYX19_01780 [Candidatus Woesearchaeota archaeon]|nr:hypothetical protein [Candidatus Woesearchaeota archaeon]